MIGFLFFGLILSAVIAYAAAPYLAARIDDRPMTQGERDQFAWSLMGVCAALFFLAVLVIGVHE